MSSIYYTYKLLTGYESIPHFEAIRYATLQFKHFPDKIDLWGRECGIYLPTSVFFSQLITHFPNPCWKAPSWSQTAQIYIFLSLCKYAGIVRATNLHIYHALGCPQMLISNKILRKFIATRKHSEKIMPKKGKKRRPTPNMFESHPTRKFTPAEQYHKETSFFCTEINWQLDKGRFTPTN